MARYNREFLVPYLQSVCALHLADKKLCEKSRFLKQKIIHLQKGRPNLLPEKPMLKPVFTLGRMLSFLVGILGLIGFMVGILLNDLRPMLQIFFLSSSGSLACIFLGGAIYLSIKTFADNQYKLRSYKYELADYEETNIANSSFKAKIPMLQTQLQQCIAENHRVCSLLNQVYCANIIPRPFRNIHSAIYLYDWFRTSRTDDLDMALTMLVHNQNNDKVNQISDKHAAIILEQAIALASQQYVLDQQHYHQEMRIKLKQTATTAEEQNIYLSMMESTAAASAYLATADYLNQI